MPTITVSVDADRIAAAIVRDIERDLSDRRGLRHEWEAIDDEIRDEIIREWRSIAARHIRRAAAHSGPASPKARLNRTTSSTRRS